VDTRTFIHELELYDYFYVESRHKVAIVERNCGDTCKIWYYSQEEVDYRIQRHRLNPFLHPIFQEALRHFPIGGLSNEIKVRQEDRL
jgi:hypothetical protein